MQHTANSSQQIAPRFLASLHTPNQSFSGEAPVQTPDSQGGGMDWADNQAKERDVAKSRLSDQKFNIRDYPDPLLPRQQIPSRNYPTGVTPELEKYLLDVIASIRAGNDPSAS